MYVFVFRTHNLIFRVFALRTIAQILTNPNVNTLSPLTENNWNM